MRSQRTARTIKDLGELYGVAQTQLARRFDIPIRTVQEGQAGRRDPPANMVMMPEELLYMQRLEKNGETKKD